MTYNITVPTSGSAVFHVSVLGAYTARRPAVPGS